MPALQIKHGVVELLIELYRGGCQVKETRTGMLPIHWAAKNLTPTPIVKLLLDSYPEGLQETQSKFENNRSVFGARPSPGHPQNPHYSGKRLLNNWLLAEVLGSGVDASVEVLEARSRDRRSGGAGAAAARAAAAPRGLRCGRPRTPRRPVDACAGFRS